MENQIDVIAKIMVKGIANKYIKVQNVWEGKDAQRSAYIKAKKLLKSYKEDIRKIYLKVKI